MHERTGVERVLRAEDRLDGLLIAFLYRALDDDVQMIGALAHGDDRLAWPEIADVEHGPQPADLVVIQPVEGRVLRIESLHRRLSACFISHQERGRRAKRGW